MARSESLIRCLRPWAGILVATVLVMAAASARAQTILDPTTAEFSPSIDHATVLPDGSLMVDHYELSFYETGATAPFSTIWLGKPSPDTDGKVRANFSTALVPTPPAGVQYTAAVAAVGPTGAGVSSLSNAFEFSGGCAYTASPALQSISSGASSGSVSVTTTAGCAWTALSNASWLTVSSGASSAGSGVVSFNASANTQTAPRSGTLTVAAQTVTVTQAGACAYSLSPQLVDVAAGGGVAATTVTTGGGCAWSSTSNVAWISVTSGSTGSGTGTVNVSVAPNTGAARSGSVTIAGQTLTVRQGAVCAYSVSPTSQSTTAASGAASVAVASAAGCNWTAVSQASWITVTAGGAGSANGTVNYAVAANTATSPRTGTLVVAGQQVSVTQAAATTVTNCTFSVSPTNVSMSGTGGVGSSTVMAGVGCSWSAGTSESWIIITGGSSGSGAGAVYYTVDSNRTKSTRTGTISVAGQTITITQARRRR